MLVLVNVSRNNKQYKNILIVIIIFETMTTYTWFNIFNYTGAYQVLRGSLTCYFPCTLLTNYGPYGKGEHFDVISVDSSTSSIHFWTQEQAYFVFKDQIISSAPIFNIDIKEYIKNNIRSHKFPQNNNKQLFTSKIYNDCDFYCTPSI